MASFLEKALLKAGWVGAVGGSPPSPRRRGRAQGDQGWSPCAFASSPWRLRTVRDGRIHDSHPPFLRLRPQLGCIWLAASRSRSVAKAPQESLVPWPAGKNTWLRLPLAISTSHCSQLEATQAAALKRMIENLDSSGAQQSSFKHIRNASVDRTRVRKSLRAPV